MVFIRYLLSTSHAGSPEEHTPLTSERERPNLASLDMPDFFFLKSTILTLLSVYLAWTPLPYYVFLFPESLKEIIFGFLLNTPFEWIAYSWGSASVPRRSSCLLCFSCTFPIGILFIDKGNEIDNKTLHSLVISWGPTQHSGNHLFTHPLVLKPRYRKRHCSIEW